MACVDDGKPDEGFPMLMEELDKSIGSVVQPKNNLKCVQYCGKTNTIVQNGVIGAQKAQVNIL